MRFIEKLVPSILLLVLTTSALGKPKKEISSSSTSDVDKCSPEIIAYDKQGNSTLWDSVQSLQKELNSYVRVIFRGNISEQLKVKDATDLEIIGECNAVIRSLSISESRNILVSRISF